MSQLTNGIVVPTALRDSFTADLRKRRVIYFCGPCSIGKISVAHELLNSQTVKEYSAFAPDFK